MAPRFRRLITWLFIAVFFVAAPAVILSTAGYSYNFAKQRLERTGVLIADTLPSGAKVYVNDKPFGKTTPVRIGLLLPGTYRIRFEKSGYQPVSKEIEIHSQETTFLNDIILFRQGLPTLEQEAAFSAAAVSPDGQYSAVVSDAKPWTELKVYDHGRGGVYLPYRTEYEGADDLRLVWAPDSKKLLIGLPGRKTSAFLLWDSLHPRQVVDLTAVLGMNLDQVFWSDDGQKLYAAGGLLYEIDPRTLSVAERGPAASAMNVNGEICSGISYGDEGAEAVERTLGSDRFSTVTSLPNGDYAPAAGSSAFLAFVSERSDAVLVVDPNLPAESAVVFKGHGKHAVWSEDGGNLLYWDELELHAYDAKRNADALVTRLGVPIRKAAWYQQLGLIMFSSDNAVYEADSARLERDLLPIASFTRLADFSTDKAGSEAVFVGAIGRIEGVWSLKIR